MNFLERGSLYLPFSESLPSQSSSGQRPVKVTHDQELDELQVL